MTTTEFGANSEPAEDLSGFLRRWQSFERNSPGAAARYLADRPNVAAKLAAARANQQSAAPPPPPPPSSIASTPAPPPPPLPPPARPAYLARPAPPPPPPLRTANGAADPNAPMTSGQKWVLAGVVMFVLSLFNDCGTQSSRSLCEELLEENRSTAIGGYMTEEQYISNCMETNRDLEDGKLDGR